MTATIREQIIEAAVTLLNTGTPGGVPQLARTLGHPNEASQLPAMTCFPLRETVDSLATGHGGPFVRRELVLRFVAYNSGAPVDASLDPIIAWVAQLGGQTFGGLAEDTREEELTWQYEEQDFPFAAVAMDFRIIYNTARNDQTLPFNP